MKKIVLLISLFFITTGCFGRIKSYDEIDYKTYTKMIEEKEDFILYIGSANCSHCQEFGPTIKKVIRKYQLDIKYIDISKLKVKQYDILKNKTKLQGTPTIVFIHKGVVDSGSSNKIQGTVPIDEVESMLKKKGYIE